MDWSLVGNIFSISISVIAIILSVVSLWQSHFAKFNPIITVGLLGLRIYPIRSGKEKWFIPSLDVPVTITNEGARPGTVMGLRICMSFPDLPIPNNREIFPLKWGVDYQKFEAISKRRFEWTKEATSMYLRPFVVLPKQTIANHFLFESRWDDAVIQKKILCTLEVFTSTNRKWVEVAKWNFKIDPVWWGELTSKGHCFLVHEENLAATLHEQAVIPPDLHKYTGTKEPIPENGFEDSEPSFLDYGKKD